MEFEHATVLTGGIATGKSTVAKIFSTLDIPIIDADKIAHLVLDKHHEKIAQCFGNTYVQDKKVNRKALGQLIFSDIEQKKRLESLLHPLIYDEISAKANTLDLLKKPYLVDIPLFFETNRYPIKESILVYTTQTLQLERLMRRDNSTKKEAQQRIDAQIDIEEKKKLANYIIDNSQDIKSLNQQVHKIYNEIYNFS